MLFAWHSASNYPELAPVSKLPPDYPQTDVRVGGNCLWGVKLCKIRGLMRGILSFHPHPKNTSPPKKKDVRLGDNYKEVKRCKIMAVRGGNGGIFRFYSPKITP